MIRHLLAITSQTIYVCGVHRIIRELLRLMVPNLAENSAYIRNDAEFRARIESAMIEATTPVTTENEYIHAIVNAACMEMKELCEALKTSCHFVGLGRIAADYLDARRFKDMLLRKDEGKLERINEIVRAREGKPIKVLMDVAKVLNDNAGIYDEMEASAKRKAAEELKKVVENVTSIVTKAEARLGEKIDKGNTEIVSCVEDVGGKVDAVGKKVDGIRLKRKRKRKFTASQIEVCRSYWDAAQNNIEVRHSINTRVTYESVYDYYRIKLAAAGVASVKLFKSILHSVQNRECADRKRTLEAKREAERKKPAQKSAKHDTIRGMKKGLTNRMLATALSIFAVAAPCAASDASPSTLRGGGALFAQSVVAASHARPDASPEKARAEIRGRVVKVADGRDANLEMLRAGFAWHYKRYDKSPEYSAAETEARTAKRGLWQDPHPINPADFRKSKRTKKNSQSSNKLSTPTASPVPLAAGIGSVVLSVKQQTF